LAIYRGPGGSGDATQDAASEVLLALQAKDAAIAAQAAAEAAQVAAELAETNAETAETNAETAETNAETAETNAETAQAAAASSASAASTSATNAAASASTATTQATNAASSASSASTSASNASTSASAASTSATNAANSATSASGSASTATTQATNASNSASSASTSATNAANSATAAAASAASINPASIAITGGSINGTTIGATTASTGKFSTLEATGVTTVQAGTVSLPAITTTGDTNTGIYFPAADTIAFTEGAAERMRIDSSGNVGIGTTAPQGPLEVALSGATVNQYLTGGVGNNATTGIFRIGSGLGRGASIQGFRGASSNVHNLDFYTYNSADVFAMRIDSSGNVLIKNNAADNNYFQIQGSTGELTLYPPRTGADYGRISTDLGAGLVFETNGAAERMRIASGGQVGINNSTPASLDSNGNQLVVGNGSANQGMTIYTGTTSTGSIYFADGTTGNDVYKGIVQYNHSNNSLDFYANYTGQSANMRIDSSGNVGIGTASPYAKLSVTTTNGNLGFTGGNTSGGSKIQAFGATSTSNGYLAFEGYTAEWMRIDSSGNVGIGTSSPLGKLEVRGSGNTALYLHTGNNSGDNSLIYFGDTGSATVGLLAYDHGTNAMTFHTSSGERMRITSGGQLLLAKTTDDSTAYGAYFSPAGSGFFHFVLTNTTATASQSAMYLNRQSSDGRLIEFRQADTAEGDISVSGTTVSYNGGHLSRWSQLPDNSKDDTILKGTVLTNLDDMCVWTKDGTVLDNEQLNKMKVSDVEGDTNVAGVFVNWTRDEDCNTDDMNVAMTGDMIIRIADGVVVQKGDLLMSAGDGTAKPQGDDIVRSKTVAKVTSNHVTCTYADGSYCVPCVLMAC
jgi:hypothetical protein